MPRTLKPLMMMRTKGLTGALLAQHAGTPGLSKAMGNSGWSPLSLFANGEYGFFVDFTDPSTMGNPAVGGTITGITDKSPNQFNFTVSAGTPTWLGNGLRFQAGAQLQNTNNLIVFKDQVISGFVYYKIANPDAQIIQFLRPVGVAPYYILARVPNAGVIVALLYDSLNNQVFPSSGVTMNYSTKYMQWTEANASGVRTNVNGSDSGLVAWTSGAPGAPNTTKFAAPHYSSATAPLDIYMYGGMVVVNRLLTATEKASLLNWFAVKGA